MIYKESGKEYNHFYCYFGNKIGLALIGVDKDIEEEELGIFEDCQLQVYDGLAAEIFKLKDLQDRAKLIGAIDDFKEKEKQDFHGTYWEIFLDFLLLEKGIKPHRLSVMLVEAITKDSFPKTFVGKDYYPEEIIKNIDSNLANLKKSKGNPHGETLKLIELACYYMGITEEILKTGEGVWYIFEKDDRYTMEEIYKYCQPKWEQKQEINLRDMIREITGLKDSEIRAVPMRIWAKDRLLDEKLKKFITTLIKQMNEK